MADLRWERTRGGKHPAYVLRAYETGVPPRGESISVRGLIVGGVRMTSRKRNKWRVWENMDRWYLEEYFYAYITAKTPEEAMDIAIVMLQAYVK